MLLYPGQGKEDGVAEGKLHVITLREELSQNWGPTRLKHGREARTETQLKVLGYLFRWSHECETGVYNVFEEKERLELTSLEKTSDEVNYSKSVIFRHVGVLQVQLHWEEDVVLQVLEVGLICFITQVLQFDKHLLAGLGSEHQAVGPELSELLLLVHHEQL